jgi:hypothetical protein
MGLPTHPSTHRVPSGMYRSGRARLRPSRSAGRALFEHRADGPPVPSKRQAGSVAPPGTPPPRAVRQLHKTRSARLPRRQLVGYREPWPSAMRGCRVPVVTRSVVNWRLVGQLSNVIVNRWVKRVAAFGVGSKKSVAPSVPKRRVAPSVGDGRELGPAGPVIVRVVVFGPA